MEMREKLDALLAELGSDRIRNNPARAALLCDNLENITQEGMPYTGMPKLNVDSTYAEIAAGYARFIDQAKPDSAEAKINEQLRDYFMSKSAYFRQK